jgi:hypothetical protein
MGREKVRPRRVSRTSRRERKLARAKGTPRPGTKKGRAPRDDNTAISQARRSKVRTLSSESANNVGRPGFGGTVPGPVDGKSSVKRVMARDPARGTSLPAADKITTTNVDLVGPVNPTILTTTNVTAPNTGSKVIRPPRQSAPVRSNTPGKVTRPGSR